MLRPRTGPEHRLDELRPADRAAGEHLDDLAAELLGVADLGRRAAARAVGDLAAVAQLGHVGVGQRADHELRAVGDVDAGGRRVDHRAHAHDHARVGLGEVTRHLVEHMRGELAAVGELDALRPAVGAGLDHLLADLRRRDDRKPESPLVHHRGQYRHAIDVHFLVPLLLTILGNRSHDVRKSICTLLLGGRWFAIDVPRFIRSSFGALIRLLCVRQPAVDHPGATIAKEPPPGDPEEHENSEPAARPTALIARH